MRRAVIASIALCILGTAAALADEPRSPAAAFVQRFYDWYAPLARKPGKSPSWIAALDQRGGEFAVPLTQALREDAEAQRRSKGDDIVGLDFDPFLYSQDPRAKYVVGKVTREGGVYLVEVRGAKPGAKPEVIAEVQASGSSFAFTNFRYGTDGDLLGMLNQMKEERAHPSD